MLMLYNMAEKSEHDIEYSLGERLNNDFGIYAAKNKNTGEVIPEVIIKSVKRNEYAFSHIISSFTDFTPRVYGHFEVSTTVQIPEYNTRQQKLLAHHKFFPNSKIHEDLGKVKYTDKTTIDEYMVMQQLPGRDLQQIYEEINERSPDPEKIIDEYMDEIFDKYTRISDVGVILYDLYARNIMVNETAKPGEKIFFIDFDPTLTTIADRPISAENRFTKEQLRNRIVWEITGVKSSMFAKPSCYNNSKDAKYAKYAKDAKGGRKHNKPTRKHRRQLKRNHCSRSNSLRMRIN